VHDARKYVIETLQEVFENLCNIFSWDYQSFVNTFSILEKKEFEFSEYWKEKWKPNKNKSLMLNIYFECTDSINVYFALKDADNAITKVYFNKLPLSIACLENILGSFTWKDEDTIQLTHSNKRDFWLFSTSNLKYKFHYPRVENGDAHGQYDLGVMYLEGAGVLQSNEEAIFWLKQSAEQKFGRAVKLLEKIL